jgi:hypothetical protein
MLVIFPTLGDVVELLSQFGRLVHYVSDLVADIVTISSIFLKKGVQNTVCRYLAS